MKKITIADVEPLIEKLHGNIAAIARTLGVNRGTVWNRVIESKTLQVSLEQARETMLDNAESKLYSNALNGDTTSLIFFLKTQGKRRGYTERLDVNLIGEIEREIKRLGLSHTSGDSEDVTGGSDAQPFIS